MTESWLDTESSEETDAFSSYFWEQHRRQLADGSFWADRIKELREQPDERLHLALDNLPLPAAFREAAVAVRSIIRIKRKNKLNYDSELKLLYWLAAIKSFCVPYSELLHEPGYNVVAIIPGKEIRALDFSYSTLGYEELELLNKTDKKWITEFWGEPTAHTTLHVMHHDLWSKYEKKVASQRKEWMQRLLRSIGRRKGGQFSHCNFALR